jgi:hypothetical protein
MDWRIWRYCTIEEARVGHDEVVQSLRASAEN